MEKTQTYDDPSSVTAKDGEVEVDGPDAVDVNMTPEAALESGHRLIDGATEAAGQRRLRDIPHQKGD